MKKDLPKNVHLLTFEPWKENSILIRFEHIFDKDEDKTYSQPVSFDLIQDLFHGFDVVSIRETSLSANQWLDEVNRLSFTTKRAIKLHETSQNNHTRAKITLNPMEIRTFVVVFKLL